MAEEQLVTREVAEDEFVRLCKARDIDNDVASMTEADQKQFLDQKRKVVAAICRGNVTVEADGTVHFTGAITGNGGALALTFYEATGADLMAADAAQGGVEKAVSVATSMTRSKKGAISTLKIRDFHVVIALANLFLD